MRHAKDSPWETWGQVDPLWAIVTQDGKEQGQWDRQEFFASGEATIGWLWERASQFGLPQAQRRGLDFGCGVGRLTRALGERMEEVQGLDISHSMITLAREYNAEFRNLRFDVHQAPDLSAYESESFDVICSLLVLQHLPSEEEMVGFIKEFVRLLTPGGVLLLQLPEDNPEEFAHKSLRSRMRPRTRLAGMLHRLGVSPKFLYRRLGWKPEMTMRGIAINEVESLIEQFGATVVWISDATVDTSKVSNIFYLITR